MERKTWKAHGLRLVAWGLGGYYFAIYDGERRVAHGSARSMDGAKKGAVESAKLIADQRRTRRAS